MLASVSGREGDRKAADAQTTEETGDRVAHAFDDDETTDDQDEDFNRPLDQDDDRLFKGISAAWAVAVVASDDVDKPHHRPQNNRHRGNLKRLDDERFGKQHGGIRGHACRQDAQGHVDADSREQGGNRLDEAAGELAGQFGAVALKLRQDEPVEQFLRQAAGEQGKQDY